MNKLAIIILAAGKGTRMKSNVVKVLHPLAGLPMISYPVQAAQLLDDCLARTNPEAQDCGA